MGSAPSDSESRPNWARKEQGAAVPIAMGETAAEGIRQASEGQRQLDEAMRPPARPQDYRP